MTHDEAIRTLAESILTLASRLPHRFSEKCYTRLEEIGDCYKFEETNQP